MGKSYQISKSVFDIFLSAAAIILLIPLLVLIFILIRVNDGSPSLYLGERVGKKEVNFKIIKFRTMYLNLEKKSGGNVTSDNDPRITRIGKILRKYKLDELPQLFNILKGDMSLVGPRPEVKEYVDLYSKEDKKIILSVKPGITDLSSLEFVQLGKTLGKNDNQVHFNIQVEKVLKRKIELRREYVQNMSFFLDLKIIIKTINKILR